MLPTVLVAKTVLSAIQAASAMLNSSREYDGNTPSPCDTSPVGTKGRGLAFAGAQCGGGRWGCDSLVCACTHSSALSCACVTPAQLSPVRTHAPMYAMCGRLECTQDTPHTLVFWRPDAGRYRAFTYSQAQPGRNVRGPKPWCSSSTRRVLVLALA